MHTFISFLTGSGLFYSFRFFPFITFFLILLISLFLIYKKNIFQIFFLLTGIAYAFIRYEPVEPLTIPDERITVRGFFESYPMKTEKGSYWQEFFVHTAQSKDGQFKKEITRRKFILFSNEAYESGREYQLEVKTLERFKRFNPGGNKGENIPARIVSSEQIGLRNAAFRTMFQEYRHNMSNYIEERFPNDSGALIKSITIGQKSQMNDELREAFNAAGLAHILSISGTHFGLFSVILFTLSS